MFRHTIEMHICLHTSYETSIWELISWKQCDECMEWMAREENAYHNFLSWKMNDLILIWMKEFSIDKNKNDSSITIPQAVPMLCMLCENLYNNTYCAKIWPHSEQQTMPIRILCDEIEKMRENHIVHCDWMHSFNPPEKKVTVSY